MTTHMNKPCVSNKIMIVDRKESTKTFDTICGIIGENPEDLDDNLVVTIKITYNKLTKFNEGESDKEDENVQL